MGYKKMKTLFYSFPLVPSLLQLHNSMHFPFACIYILSPILYIYIIAYSWRFSAIVKPLLQELMLLLSKGKKERFRLN